MTTVAIHQPNYLPWLGYFYKIVNCDTFVFLDNVQYSKGGFINRNRIKTPQGVTWLTVDVLTRGRYGQLIKDTEIKNNISWGSAHKKSLQSLRQSYSRAPYFEKYLACLDAAFCTEREKLAELNIFLVKTICKALGIDGVRFLRASELDVAGESTQLLVNICQSVGASTYLSGPSGRTYLDESVFATRDIELRYTDFKHPVYAQLYGDFTPNMSIVDLIFNEGERSLDILRRARE